MDVLETYPGTSCSNPDRRARPDRRGRSTRPPAGEALHPPRRLRPLPLLPGLPAARPLHDRGARADRLDPQDPARRRVDRVHRTGQRVDARPPPLRRPPAEWGSSSATSTSPTSSAAWPRPRALARRLRRGRAQRVRRGGGRSAGADVRRRLPRGLQGGLPASHRASTSAVWRTSRATRGSRLLSHERMDAAPGEARLKIFRIGPPLSLSQVLPALSAMGVEVVDERPYELEAASAVLRLRLRPALHAGPAARGARALPGHGERCLGGAGRE